MDKDKLLAIAKSYIGTPHINGGMVKGAGVDCCTLPAMMYKEMGMFNGAIQPGYSADWFCQKECKELLLEYLKKYCEPVQDLEIGDLISYQWGRAKYAHLALYLGGGKVVHCQARIGVEITDLCNPYFFYGNGTSRVSGYWRLK